MIPEDLYQPILAVGVDLAESVDPGMVVVRGVHAAERLTDLTFDLPLCWIAEGKQRGATPEEWEVAYDHEALPAVWVTADRSVVNCRECLDWLHA